MYFITVIEKNESEILSQRCVGYFERKDDAVVTVKENIYDIHESICDYAVIVELKQGLYSAVYEEIWFKYNNETNKYNTIDKPQWSYNYFNWGIG